MIPSLKKFARRALSRVRQTLRRLAGVHEYEAQTPKVYWDESVKLALMDLVMESETRASGRVQVITLADFRASIGALWDRYEQRILLIAESTISRMIGRGNTFIPQEKDTWLLLFPGLPEPEALARADAIAKKIGEKLVGAQFTESPPPLPEASKLDLNGAMNADGTLNMERLKTAIENVRRVASGLPALAPPAASAGKRPSLQVRPSVVTAPEAKSEAGQMTTLFRPAWNAETQSVDAFFFRALKSDGTEVFTAHGPAPGDATTLELLSTAAKHFSAMCERGLRATLTIPVPFTILHGPRAVDAQRIISGLRQRDRLMHLRIEVTHIPYRIGAEILVGARELFRPYVREVGFLIDPFSMSDQVLALDHIMLGIETQRAATRNEDEIFQAMLVFRQRAGRRRTYMLGLHTRTQVTHAVTAGLLEVGGAAIAPETKKLPDHIVIIHRQDLMS